MTMNSGRKIGKHVDGNRWFNRIATYANRELLGLKRVSAAAEQQFPRKYREMYRDHGAPKTVALIMKDTGMGLAAAWEELKRMMNTPVK